ncbi:MAG: hypothetical protein Q4E63_09215 [Prevotellaceae bacterium]|nr:hypothetical protein [Prevotellaceae bacterium]
MEREKVCTFALAFEERPFGDKRKVTAEHPESDKKTSSLNGFT